MCCGASVTCIGNLYCISCMEYIGVSYDVIVCVLTLLWWVIPPVVSCAAVMNICEAEAGSVLYKTCAAV
jgi:hypothetical protein